MDVPVPSNYALLGSSGSATVKSVCPEALLAGVMLALSCPAWAALGAAESSVEVDREALRGQQHVSSAQQYDVHEIDLDSGSVVREYATPQGQVFAVSWSGALPPDLRQLFGVYFERYRSAAAAQSQPGMHRHLSISQPDLVVQSEGRLRDFHGMAYVPSLVPAGVSIAGLH
jgi:hypothetical protein